MNLASGAMNPGGNVNNDYNLDRNGTPRDTVVYSNGKTGKDRKDSRPDALSDTHVVEIKSFKDGTEKPIARNTTDQTIIQRNGAKADGKRHAVIMDTSGSRDSARPSRELSGKSNVYHLNRDTGEWSHWDPLANGRKGDWKPDFLTTREVSEALGVNYLLNNPREKFHTCTVKYLLNGCC